MDAGMKLRFLFALIIGKLIFIIIKIFHLKGSTYLPGKIATRIYPQLIAKLSIQIPKHVFITGTNGKTTTACMLSHFVKCNHMKVCHNATGANLKSGIATELLKSTSLTGNIANIDFGIWEVDEFAFTFLLTQIKPTIIVFLNAFRDQLDRYGEVNNIIRAWSAALQKSDAKSLILINKNNHNLSALAIPAHLQVYYFQIDREMPAEQLIKQGNNNTENADVIGSVVKHNQNGTKLSINYPEGEIDLFLNYSANYQFYNLLAAFSIYYYLHLPLQHLPNALPNFSPPFGRMEKLTYKNKEIIIILIKNPSSANEVLDALYTDWDQQNSILFILNNTEIDGLDTSWIWDVDFENFVTLLDRDSNIHLSGSKAADLGIRLKYADVHVDKIHIHQNILPVLNNKAINKLYILPNYSGLLELQSLLIKNKIKKTYLDHAHA